MRRRTNRRPRQGRWHWGMLGAGLLLWHGVQASVAEPETLSADTPVAVWLADAPLEWLEALNLGQAAPGSQPTTDKAKPPRQGTPTVLPARQLPSTLLAMAEAGAAIAVVYPDVNEPYRSVFTSIIQGIEERAKIPVISLALSPGTDAVSLRSQLKAAQVQVVIALGRQGMQAVEALRSEFGVIVGGVVTVPEEEATDRAVISLSPDPALLFARLKELATEVQRVHVVYNPKQSRWLIRLAQDAARQQHLELHTQEAHDLKTAIQCYQTVLAGADEMRDVIWLPQDSITADETVILPLILRESWNRRLLVFSSSFAHVKRGVLFSLYPDNVGLGRNLAGSALHYLKAGRVQVRGLSPLQNVQLAINLRTAKHLGLRFSSEQESAFNTVFTGQ